MRSIVNIAKRYPDKFAMGLLFLLAVLIYANTFNHDYAWDDILVITDNARVQKGFAGIPEHFQKDVRVFASDFTGFRPVTHTTFSIEYELFGLNPMTGHVTNVILFALLCLVIYRSIRLLLPEYQYYFPFLVVLLFLVHPIHVEVVANIKSRDEILAMLFGMLMLNQFLIFHKKGTWTSLVFSLIFMGLASLSKENGIVFAFLPLVVILTLFNDDWRQKVKFLMVTPLLLVIVVGVSFILNGSAPWVFSPVEPAGVLESTFLGNPFVVIDSYWEKIGSAGMLIFRYLGKFFWPYPLTYYSGYNQVPYIDWNHAIVAVAFMVNLVTIVFAIVQTFRKKTRVLNFSILYFYLFITLYLQILFLLSDTMADRFMFTPSLGPSIWVVWGLYTVMRVEPGSEFKVTKEKKIKFGSGKVKLMLGMLGAIFLILSVLTANRNMAWKDTYTLIANDIVHLEDCARAHYYLANELSKKLDHDPNQPKVKDRMFSEYAKAVNITDSAYYAYIDWGINLMRFSMFEKAEDVLKRAASVYPHYPDPWFHLGKAQFYLQKFNESAVNLERSRMLDPLPDETWELLGRSLERSGQFDKATSIIDEAIARNPGNLLFRDVKADIYMDKGEYKASIEHVLDIIDRDPNNPVWWRKVIGLHQLAGDQEGADEYYRTAIHKRILKRSGQ